MESQQFTKRSAIHPWMSAPKIEIFQSGVVDWNIDRLTLPALMLLAGLKLLQRRCVVLILCEWWVLKRNDSILGINRFSKVLEFIKISPTGEGDTCRDSRKTLLSVKMTVRQQFPKFDTHNVFSSFYAWISNTMTAKFTLKANIRDDLKVRCVVLGKKFW